LCGVYAAAVIAQGGIKLVANIYRGWIGERALRDLRRQVYARMRPSVAMQRLDTAQGTAAAMIVAEVEPIGGFVGSAVAEPLLQAGILASVVAYIVHLDPWMAFAALALFVPQLVFVPIMQHSMNRRVGTRVWILRQIGAGVIGAKPTGPENAREAEDEHRIKRVFQLDIGIFKLKFTMNFLMNLCSHMQVIAVLLLGGWLVHIGQIEVGAVVACISSVGRLSDPWGDLLNYFREISLSRVKYELLVEAMETAEEAA
jgi:ABC-type multidrug transport system fused ATPase/permease subunit